MARKTLDNNRNFIEQREDALYYLLILTNANSASYFHELAEDLLAPMVVNIKENTSVKIISSIAQLDSFFESSLTSSKAIYFLINVDLYWSNLDFQGYQMALEIMQKGGIDEKQLNFYFLSFVGRERLFDVCTGINKFFAKTFEHVQLPITARKISIQFTPILRAKWNFIKKYALTSSGILDQLLHDIRPHLSKSTPYLVNAIELFNRQILDIPEIAGDELINHIKAYNGWKELNADSTSYSGFLAKTYSLLATRILQLSPDKAGAVTLNSNRRFKILLLEDDVDEIKRIKDIFDPFFEVIPFDDGVEALQELQLFGTSYYAILVDLELLDKTKKLQQKVQGIEVYEYARINLPFLVKRVITGMPSKGIAELLNVNTKEILKKQHLAAFGKDELVVDFIIQLDIDIRKQAKLLKLKGPNSTFWADFSRQGGEGGMFRRFYDYLKNEKNEAFENMWVDIRSTLKKLEEDINSVKIPTEFGKIKNAKKVVENIDEGEKIEFLKKLLLHRLIVISRYKDGEIMYYKNLRNTDLSFFHLPFWSSQLPVDPGVYMFYLGFSASKMQPPNPTSDASMVQFILNHNQLFEEEISYIESKPGLVELHFAHFYQSNKTFCELIESLLGLILQHQKSDSPRKYFQQNYPEILENIFDMDDRFAVKFFQTLLKENKLNNRPLLREEVVGKLAQFIYDESDEGDLSEDFMRLPKNLQDLATNASQHL